MDCNQLSINCRLSIIWSLQCERWWCECGSVSDPGTPAASRQLATSTSQLQMSNCHFWRPNTPQSTEPEWTPIRMSTSCCSSRRTYLQHNTLLQHSVETRVGMLGLFLPNGADHAEAHLYTAAGVSPLWLWNSRDAVITVPQNLNPQTLVLLNR